MDDSDNYSSINNVVSEMNNTSIILSSGKYSKSMNPDFMKNLSSNMKYYFEMSIVKPDFLFGLQDEFEKTFRHYLLL